MIDGVYAVGPGGAVMFHPLPAPTDADVTAIAERTFRKISKKVDALSDEHSEALAADEPLLAAPEGVFARGDSCGGAWGSMSCPNRFRC